MKVISFLILFLITPFHNFNEVKHEYYVSVTNIEYVKEQQSLQIISQIFIDDFEKLLQERYDETVTLAPDNNKDTIEKYMERYLEDKLKLEVNSNPVNFKFIGKEYKDDIAYCYLEVEDVSSLYSIAVKNQILFDVFPEQQNILRIKGLGKNKSFLLFPDNDNCMLNFN